MAFLDRCRFQAGHREKILGVVIQVEWFERRVEVRLVQVDADVEWFACQGKQRVDMDLVLSPSLVVGTARARLAVKSPSWSWKHVG